MPKYLIERTVPGAGQMSADDLRGVAGQSNEVIAGLGVPYRWITTYVAGDKLYCVHETDTAETVHEHARCGGFPIDTVTEIAAVIDPTTANEDVS